MVEGAGGLRFQPENQGQGPPPTPMREKRLSGLL